MYVNKTLIIGTIIIIAAGSYSALAQATAAKKQVNLTRVFVGGYLVAIILAIADLFTPLRGVATAFLWLAVTSALFVIIPDVAARIQKRG